MTCAYPSHKRLIYIYLFIYRETSESSVRFFAFGTAQAPGYLYLPRCQVPGLLLLFGEKNVIVRDTCET